jgi:hypothetical protein
LTERVAWVCFAAIVVLAAEGRPGAQRGGGAGVPQTARQAAPVDLTGNWVSVVSEDWRFRMVTPPKGDYGAVPLNAEGRKVADAWDPAKDAAAGDACRWFGAGGIMRVPTRLRISWQDDNTLKVETDAGQQVRLFRFGASQPPAGEPTWQGHSVANWELVSGGEGGRPRWGTLRVATRGMRPGYLRRNGVPYSENAVITEYYDRHTLRGGTEWFTVTSIVNDPMYLNQEFITSTDFKKEPDGSKWNPTSCETT